MTSGPGSDQRRVRRRSLYRLHERGILGTAAILAFLLLWECLGRGWLADALRPLLGQSAAILAVRPIFLPPPSAVAEAAWRMYVVTGEIWRDLRLSAAEFGLALLVALLLGVPAGLLSGRGRLVAAGTEPLVTALNATPQVALLPLVVLWLGTGLVARVFIIALLMIVPVLVNARAAVRTVEPKLLRLARSMGASEAMVVRSIILPSATPFLLAGLRLAIGRGMVGIVVGELYGGARGIGVMINQAGSRFQTANVFVGVATIVAAGMLLAEAVRRCELRLDAWRQPVAGPAGAEG